MDKELKDYLHLYLGCRCKYLHQEKKGLINIYEGVGMWKLIAIHYTEGKVNLEAKGCIEVVNINEVKPILRQLSDMTEWELDEILIIGEHRHNGTGLKGFITGWKAFGSETFLYLLSKRFDLFGLIESGLAINISTIQQTNQS